METTQEKIQLSPVIPLLYLIIPGIIDFITLFFFATIGDTIKNQFESTISNILIYTIIILFVVLPFATWFLKKCREPEENNSTDNNKKNILQSIAGLGGIGFFIIIFVIIANNTKILSLSDNAEMALFLLLFAILIVYLGTLLTTPTIAKKEKISSLLFYTMSILVVNFFILIGTSYFRYVAGGLADPGINGTRIIYTIILYPLFLAFFASPRLINSTLTQNWQPNIVLYLGFLYIVWQSVI